jgi:hypothetical protein
MHIAIILLPLLAFIKTRFALTIKKWQKVKITIEPFFLPYIIIMIMSEISFERRAQLVSSLTHSLSPLVFLSSSLVIVESCCDY